jgi:hypothetical protein
LRKGLGRRDPAQLYSAITFVCWPGTGSSGGRQAPFLGLCSGPPPPSGIRARLGFEPSTFTLGGRKRTDTFDGGMAVSVLTCCGKKKKNTTKSSTTKSKHRNEERTRECGAASTSSYVERKLGQFMVRHNLAKSLHVRAEALYSLTAIPRRMHQISSDLRN